MKHMVAGHFLYGESYTLDGFRTMLKRSLIFTYCIVQIYILH